MSDSEDRDILNDIRALENALAPQFDLCDNAPIENCTPSLVSSPSPIDEAPSPHSSTDQTTLQTVFNLNKKLLAQLYAARDEMSMLLDECGQKLALIDERLNQHTKVAASSKVMITTAGIPYFKDKNHFAAGPNEDTKIKIMRNELQVVSLRKVCRWTPKDRETLMKSIKHEAFSSALVAFEDTRNLDGSFEKLVNGTSHQSTNACAKISKNFKDIVGPLGTKEFDWLKIAVIDFDGKHSAEECRVMWNVFLHPDINKCKWLKAEDLKMKKIAEQHRFQDWDSIARKLNTNRSGYQCFIRYNTTRSIKDLTGRPWTPKECQTLSAIVNELRLGDFVPWGQVAECMFHRTKQQVYFRWKYSSAPHLKKGRFTEEEDEVLLNAVKQYGANFSKIAVTLLPHRSTIQLNDHYHTLLSRTKNSNVWTVNDDIKLIESYNELGPDWSQIAKILMDKSRTQVRHRYTALCKFLKKGISIANIPRRNKVETSSVQDADPDDAMYDEIDENVIDELLIQHFCCLELASNRYEERTFRDTLELEDIVKRLYKVLQYLGANLGIPDNFNDEPLSKIEKQILRSLKEYCSLENDKTRRGDFIERIRLKMFGSQDDGTEKASLVLSYPSESQVKRESVMTEKIDYDLHMNNHFIIEMSMEFETPEIVNTQMSDDEELLGFEKISNLLLLRNYNSLRERTQNIFTPVLESRVDQDNNLNEYDDKRDISNVQASTISSTANLNTLQERGLKFMQHCKKVVAASRARVEVHQLSNIHFEICSGIEPDIATLVAFKNVLSLKRLFDTEVAANLVVRKKPVKCQKAYNLLKKRLTQLFKYPIGMSHSFVPQVYMEKIFQEGSEIISRKRKLSTGINVRRKKSKSTEEK